MNLLTNPGPSEFDLEDPDDLDERTLTPAECGRLGGEVMKSRVEGTTYYTDIGLRGGQQTKAAQEGNPQYYSNIARLAGLKNAAKGRAYFQELGRKSGLARAAKLARGRADV